VVLEELIKAGDVEQLSRFLDSIAPAETARAVSRLAEEDRSNLLVLLSPQDAAEVLHDLPDEQAADMIEDIPPEEAAAIIEQMPGDEQADILADIDTAEAEAILKAMSPVEAEKTRQLLQYPEDTAGGIVGGEEFRSMPLVQRSFRRLSWLSINIVLNIIAASVIAFYQDTLSAVIALAVFLPIISDMSGCSGNQAVAVSIRELTLGLIKPYEVVRVFLKEIGVGLANGVVLGILLGAVAVFWKGNPYLGLVVGGALATNTVVAVCLGGVVPLFLKWIRMDPALASGPILTTVTDMCGFFFALSFATAVLPLLSSSV
jgi:Mg/Co/Ni transporter MgtE